MTTLIALLSVSLHAAEVADVWGADPVQTQADIFRALSQPLPPPAPATSPDDVGFLSANDPNLPSAVRAAAKSTFRVVVATGGKGDALKLFGKRSINDVIRDFDRIPVTKKMSAVEKRIFLYELKMCLYQNIHPCLIHDTIEYGSAYVTGDGRDIRTAAHVVGSSIDERPVPLFILDERGNIAHGPSTLMTMGVAKLPYDPDANDVPNDQVILRTNITLGRPIPIAKTPPGPGEPVYIAGVPKKTDTRVSLGKEDSDGLTVRVSRGQILSAEEVMTRLERSGVYLNQTTVAETIAPSFATSADGAKGLSGGAILNQRGELISTFTNSFPDNDAATPHRLSFGPRNMLTVPN